MALIPIIAIFLSSLILIKTVSDFKKNKITLPIFLLWTILWLIIIVVAILPQAAVFIDKLVGEGRALDAIVYFSIFFIFYILFKIVTRLEKIESDITTIVRKIALDDKDDQK